MEIAIYTAILLAAAYYDWKENRIPNVLCLFAAGLGMLLLFTGGQGDQLIRWGTTAIILFFLLFPLWLLRVIGAGDIKLILTGVFFLKKDIGLFLSCGGIALAMLSLFYMIRRKNLKRRCLLFYGYVMECIREQRIKPYPFFKNRDVSDGGIQVSYGLLLGQLCLCLIRIYHKAG